MAEAAPAMLTRRRTLEPKLPARKFILATNQVGDRAEREDLQ